MNIIRRIGTQRHKFKLEFVMRKIKFSRNLTGKIYISIRRGDHKMKTENLIEMNASSQCDLKKEIVTFPSITLFYDEQEHKYQEKQGEMKILLLTNKDDKKLIGKVPFDVAEFVNSKRDTGLVSNQTEEKVKIKKQVEEIPEKLKMEATIQFNVFLKFIGEASETDKSIKDDKVRSQSPFDKLKNFFFGNDNQEQKPKQVQSPKKKTETQLKQKKISVKENPGKSRQNKSKQPRYEQIEFSDEQKPKQTPKRQRTNSDYQQSKHSQKQKNSKRTKQEIKIVKQQSDEEESQNIEEKIQPVKQNQSSRQRKYVQSKKSEEENEEVQQQSNNRNDDSNKQNKSQTNKNVDQKNGQKPTKNMVHPKQRDILTQYEDRSNKKSNYNKSEQPYNIKHNQKNTEFYFDDPASFPPHLQPNYKKNNQKDSNNKEPKPPQTMKIVKEQSKNEKKPKTDRQIQKDKQIFQEDELDDALQALEQKNNPQGPSPKRKVKDNTIQISSKQIKKERQKKKHQLKNIHQQRTKQQAQPPVIPKNISKGKDLNTIKAEKQQKPAQITEVKQKQLTSKVQEDLNSSQVKNLFTSFDEPPQKQQKRFIINPKKVEQNESNIFMKEELDKKSKELLEMRMKLDYLQNIQKKLKEEQNLRQAAQKTVNNLKEQNARLQKDLQRIKQENNSLRSENQNQSSIFRATHDHYLNNSDQNNLEEQNKRLEREKNEMIVNMAKERQKHSKQLKLLKEQLEKEKLKYKELQNISKIDLKKLKDQNLKISGNLEIMKDKTKQKTRENQTLLKQNKSLHTDVIELKDKLETLKIKICEKLNEANEHGEAELMEVLTELCQDM